MQRIKRFGVFQTAKVAAIIYFLIALLLVIPMILFISPSNSSSFGGFSEFGDIFFLLVPFLYGIAAFIMTAIGCAVYNLIAKWTGGIELELDTFEEKEVLDK